MNEKQCAEKIIEQSLIQIQGGSIELNRDIIREICEHQFVGLKLSHPEISEINPDFERISEKILSVYSAGTTINSIIQFKDSRHQEWLDRKRDKVNNGLHWNSFKALMSRHLSEVQIAELDNSTDKLLSSIEDPEREGDWHSRGLVIGDVQSGKTTNFIALVNKAIDTGYKVVVVLSGLHNNLRRQTQIRFEEGVSGWNTQSKQNEKPFCGIANPAPVNIDPYDLKISHLTTRDDKGDFLANQESGLKLGVGCVYSINKKNYKTLENLISFFRIELEGVGNRGSIPFLLIDDEADNASIDTSRPDEDSSRINGLVKELLNLFPRNSYIGYTATPFANILINPEDEDDLFPRNFLMTLGRPENYIGAKEIFGMVNDEGEEDNEEIIERDTRYHWFVNLDAAPFNSDWRDFIPSPNRADSLEFMDELPLSLKDAIYSFIIAVTVRNLRGDQFEHKTMLIHATRLKILQNRLRDLVSNFIDEIYAAFAVSQLDEQNEHLERLKRVFTRCYSNIPETWNELAPDLTSSVSLLKNHVYGINGDNKDVIDEEEYPNGLNSIRIGGDKLSRGLTLPGLMTSYFLRVSRMYDTLMQMGRWFGYRGNYEDLCQIFTTAQLYNWFGHVSNAAESLRSRIFEMNQMDYTPTEYTQQVQAHPGSMLVTALNKQRYTRRIALSFSEELIQLTSFDLSIKGIASQKRNANRIEVLMDKLLLGFRYEEKRGARVFKGVNPEIVNKLIKEFEHTEEAGVWHSSNILSYIHTMNIKGELTEWNIAFQTSTKPAVGAISKSFSTYNMVSNIRSGAKSALGIFSMSNRNLASIGHEKFDFDSDPLIGAENKTRRHIRRSRSPKVGLLIIYLVTPKEGDKFFEPLYSLAISFPKSDNAATISYVAGAGYDTLHEDL